MLLDIFNTSAFNMTSLTKAINVVPNMYGRLQQLNLFPGQGVPTTQVAIEMENGVLNLLPQQPRGSGQTTVAKPPKRQAIPFVIPYIPHDDFIQASDIQNLRAFGSENELETLQTVVNRRLMAMRMKHALTLEYLRCGALKGVVLDAQGNTIVNLFTAFNIVQLEVDFDLGNNAADVAGKVMQVKRSIEDNLMGETMTGVRALCSPEWFDKFVKHPQVVDAYKFYQSVQAPLQKDVRKGFEYKDVIFEEYRGQGSVYNEDGTSTIRRFIPAGDARFFAEGTTQSFATYFAPADFFETVNTPGLEVYAKQAIDAKFQRFVEIHTQSNPLPLCARPGLLARGYSGS